MRLARHGGNPRQVQNPDAVDTSYFCSETSTADITVRLGMNRFVGLIVRNSPECTNHVYDYRAQLEQDQNSTKLPLDTGSTA